MTRETMEKCLAKRTAHAIRAATLQLARERAGQEADLTAAYGCVDWFRYDIKAPPQEADTGPLPAAARPGAGRASMSSGH